MTSKSVVPQRPEPTQGVPGHPVDPGKRGHGQQDQLRPPQDRRGQGDDRDQGDNGAGARSGSRESPGREGQDHGGPRSATDIGEARWPDVSAGACGPPEQAGHAAGRDGREQPGPHRDENESDDQEHHAHRRPAGDRTEAKAQDGGTHHPRPNARGEGGEGSRRGQPV